MEELFKFIDISYLLCIIGAVEIIVQHFKVTNSNHSRVITIGVGLLLGFIFWKINHPVNVLLATFFISVGFYSMIIKPFKNKYFKKED